MRQIFDFFALRPVFTAWELRIMWFAYLAYQAILLASLLTTYSVYGPAPLLSFLMLIVQTAVNVVLARIVLEIAANILGQGESAATGR